MVNFLSGNLAIPFLMVLAMVVGMFYTGSASCGKRPLFPKSKSYRKIGGRKTVEGEVPWQVSVRYAGDNENSLCSGSIIGEKWILTAAHCVKGKKGETLEVVSGLFHLDNDKNPHVQVHKVKRIVTQNFDKEKWTDDIAVLELANPIRLDDYSQPVCLPRETDDFIRQVCNASGWGVPKEGSADKSRTLKTVALPVIPLDYCNKLQKRVNQKITVSDNFVCTHYTRKGRTACEGNSGGPLVCLTTDGLFRQAGVITLGNECGGRRSPGLYTRVAKYLPWIREVTGLDFE